MAAPEPGLVCVHCRGRMYARPTNHGTMTLYSCPRCHISVKMPAGLELAAAPSVQRTAAASA